MSKSRLRYGPASICKRCKFCISSFQLPANTPKTLELSKAKGEFLCVLNTGTTPPCNSESDPCGFFANTEIHPGNFSEDMAGYLKAFGKLFDATQRAKIGENKEQALDKATSFYENWWESYLYWKDYSPYPIDPTFSCEHFEDK